MRTGEDTTVRVLKNALQRSSGVSRFRQRLLNDGKIWVDDARLSSPRDFQLVLLPLASASQNSVDQLMDAVVSGRAWEVEGILQTPQDPNVFASHRNGMPLLHAVALESEEIVGQLLDAMADMEHRSHPGRDTPLELAASKGHLEIMRMLLDAHADTEGCHTWPCSVVEATPLRRVCGAGQVELAKLLLDARASMRHRPPSSISIDSTTPLEIAAENGHTQIVRTLLARRAHAEGADTWPNKEVKETPLGRACRVGHVAITKMLLKAGADMYPRLGSADAPVLAVAAARGHAQIVHLLLSAGSSVNAAISDSDSWWTPVGLACQGRHLAVVRLLLKARAVLAVPAGLRVSLRQRHPKLHFSII